MLESRPIFLGDVMKKCISLGLSFVIFSESVLAQHHQHPVEEVFVDGQMISTEITQLNVSEQSVVDAAQVLKLMPGANVNRNGALTGIAQYRGMFGDRVAVTIDGVEVVSGGPNAMDAPLSYVPPMITEAIVLERGIASVSKAPSSIGGHIEAKLARGQFASEDDVSFSGFFGSRYNTNGDQSVTAMRLTGASNTHRISLLAEADRGDDLETPVGEIFPSEMQRDRIDLSYGLQTDDQKFLVYGGVLDTQDAGTPALAMDIRSIETDLAGAQYQYRFSDQLSIGFAANLTDVEHWMDNFSLRTPPSDMMGYRQNYATADGSDIKLFSEHALSFADLKLGLQLKSAEHDSVITNPNMPAFEVINFNAIERDTQSLYAEFSQSGQQGNWELGISYAQVSTDAGRVGTSGMMGMMGTNAGLLADAFNGADRDLSFDDVNVVAKYGFALSDTSRLLIEAGSKARAPSHQELYLWLPLQATGGLADGRSYVGNLDLNSERSNEINLGYEFKGKSVQFSPQVFYKDIEDYIQGTPSTNMVANMVSTMMSGAGALQFTNVDAKIMGMDLAWNYSFNKAFFLEGVVSLIESERTDEDDKLYRQSPDNARLAIHYAENAWHITLEGQVYQQQDDVSAYNGEQETAGYGVMNLRVIWQPIKRLNIEARVDNLTDKQYQDHLAGTNRVLGGDISQGEKLYGAERSFSAGVRYEF